MLDFSLNGRKQTVDVDGEMPLLWLIRDTIGLTGTKFGCGQALCGACTVMVNGVATRSCQTQVKDVAGAEVTTIEGVSGKVAEAVQKAWVNLDVPQCGYCHSGQIVSAVALLNDNKKPTDADIDAAMSGNLCRCSTYPRIRAAIHQASQTLEG
ncbi:MAG: (2Fe-2S)-binding protein [Beijerinckiaceae bacterium]|nr:(2Fe-2S)-binding protein [Beijerinckiaceae bacterium]